MRPIFYYLATCSTCQKIIQEAGITPDKFDMQDIKTDKITAKQLDDMKALAGNYEALFSRRSMQYTARGLKDVNLSEKDFRNLILEEYTFLKRPVAVIDKEIFIGNTKANVQALKERASQL
ncbi:arsenate reductase family protein [Rurimicrobium arvi]|uniref:Arsenate reductase n=1 Tax=Rurimicrobium arvi TaxID=2049916 RepID=A0ABP8MH91_9BACT